MKKRKFKYIIYIISMLLLISFTVISWIRREDPVYTATVPSSSGDITVSLTLTENGSIGTLFVDASSEDTHVGQVAARRMAKTIVAKQSLNISTISSAKHVCEAVLWATELALMDSGVDTNVFKR